MSDIDETYAAALWFMEDAQPPVPGDEHQSDLQRAGSFLCLADGIYDRQRASNQCLMYAASVMENWARIALMVE